MVYNSCPDIQQQILTMLPLIITPDILAPHLNDPDLMIVDLCSADTYQSGHLPGAIHVSPVDIVAGIKPAVGKLPSVDQLDQFFSRIGYTHEKQILVYDDEGGGWAGRFIWTLDVIGHEKSSYLNGGLHGWVAAGLSVTTRVPAINPTTCHLQIDTQFIAEKEDVISSIGDENTLIWDARSPEEYAGTKVVAARGGHVPGAINLDWLETMDHGKHRQMRPDIQDVLNARGLTRDKKIITHCQSHHRSGLTYLIGKSLGYDIRAYHGSWSEYGNDPDTVIEV